MKKDRIVGRDSNGGFADNNAKMYQAGMTREEAKSRLLGLLDKDGALLLKNDDSGETAWLGKKSIEKMVSGAAVNKSEGNGFTAKQHYAVVSDIDRLFKGAIKILERPDKNGDPNVFIHRFAAPIGFNDAVAYITVKEIRQHDRKKLYSVELIEIGKLEGTLT